MSMLDVLLQSANSGSLKNAASEYSIPPDALAGLLRQLAPAIAGGIQQNAAHNGGLDALRRALESGEHERYLDNSDALTGSDAIRDGIGILSHVFGSKDVSRAVAKKSAQRTGLDPELIKQFLPIVAAAAMAAMSKQTQGGTQLAGQGATSNLSNVLSSVLDADGDGSMVDDLLAMGQKFMR